MPHIRLAWILLIFVGLASHSVSAYSVRPPRIESIHAVDSEISILPRSNAGILDEAVRFDDRIRLTVTIKDSLAGKFLTYFLHLEPNHDLLHPDARVVTQELQLDGSYSERTEKIQRSDVRAYKGVVVSKEHTSRRMVQDSSRILHSKWQDDREFEELGWARVMLHSDDTQPHGLSYEGAFTVHGETHHIKTKASYLRTRGVDDPQLRNHKRSEDHQVVILRDGDVMSEPATDSHGHCNHEALPFNNASIFDPSVPTWNDESLFRRQSGGDISGSGAIGSNFVNSIGSTTGCPTEQKIVYLGVAADFNYVAQYSTPDLARTAVLTNMNTVSELYRSTFRVSLGVIELNIKDATRQANDPDAWNVDCNTILNDRLSLFSAWRGAKGSSDGAGLWHLMTSCATGSEVGVAWLGQLCQTSASGSGNDIVSGVAVTAASRNEWAVIAHEIGHNFGAIHDCQSGCSLATTCCPLSSSTCDAQNGFIMSAVSTSGASTFSACSIGNICSALGSTLSTTCLTTPGGRSTLSLEQCGNGIVEPGEDCDPGANSTTTCCNAQTCKFTTGSVCDPSSSTCCTPTCSFPDSSKVCRPSIDPNCDVAEYCTGNNATCPTDITTEDGTSCTSNTTTVTGLTCASGHCTSLNLQCQTAGATLNLTTQCSAKNDKSCLVSCQDPTSDNTCLQLQTALIDGSSCGYGGTCSSGGCQSGSWQRYFNALYAQNLNIAIPVTIIVALVILLVIYSIIRRCCCRRTPKNYDKRMSVASTMAGNRLSKLPPGVIPRDSRRNTLPVPPTMRQANTQSFHSMRAALPGESDFEFAQRVHDLQIRRHSILASGFQPMARPPNAFESSERPMSTPQDVFGYQNAFAGAADNNARPSSFANFGASGQPPASPFSRPNPSKLSQTTLAPLITGNYTPPHLQRQLNNDTTPPQNLSLDPLINSGTPTSAQNGASQFPPSPSASMRNFARPTVLASGPFGDGERPSSAYQLGGAQSGGLAPPTALGLQQRPISWQQGSSTVPDPTLFPPRSSSNSDLRGQYQNPQT